MMLKKTEFLSKYRIKPATFNATGLDWKSLTAIYEDFDSKRFELTTVGNSIVERLSMIKEVHSLKTRVKDPEHLIEKIIRKKRLDPDREINLDNYFSEVTDLIGVRALHLFKDEWLRIHEQILEIWDVKELPIIYIRNGDDEPVVSKKDANTLVHKHGYRSVHYLIETQPTRLPITAEIQVRTIFEEGWCEIDHRMRYPHDMDNKFLSDYLLMFNGLAGNADTMGTFIAQLKEQLEISEKDRSLYGKSIKELQKLKNEIASNAEERGRLEAIISDLEKYKRSSSNSNASVYRYAVDTATRIGSGMPNLVVGDVPPSSQPDPTHSALVQSSLPSLTFGANLFSGNRCSTCQSPLSLTVEGNFLFCVRCSTLSRGLSSAAVKITS